MRRADIAHSMCHPRTNLDRANTDLRKEFKVKAISIQQPWAWLIIRPDVLSVEERDELILRALIKDIENRSWSTTYRGPLAVHASQNYPKRKHIQHADIIYRQFGIVLPRHEEMALGGIVGVVQVLGCTRQSTSPWFLGPWGFQLAKPRPTEFVPMAGKLSLFEVPDETVRTLEMHA